MALPQDERCRTTTPGFTAEAALDAGRRRARSPSSWRIGHGRGVAAQLKGSAFHPHGGDLGTIGDYWTCKDTCASAHRACLDGCEGTWATPKGSSNCTICDNQYRSCVFGCMGDIA